MSYYKLDDEVQAVCGRFTIDLTADLMASAFQVSQVEPFDKRYNVAPTQTIPVIVCDAESGERVMRFMRWGLIPHWAKDVSIGSRLINARGETVDTKPSFHSAFKHRRCLIPTTGFYEWDKSKAVHQPYFIGMKDGSPFALAGLWETWTDADGNEVKSCTIITTTTNDLIKPLHERMPVILDSKYWDSWLDPENEDGESLKQLLKPYPAKRMQMYPVSPEVNNAQHEGEELIKEFRSS